MLTRRNFLRSAVAAAAAPTLRALKPNETTASLHLLPEAPLATIPADFLGLGYEMSSAARPGLLSAENKPYVQLLRNLGPNGVLRLGGIVADFTTYDASGTFRTEPKDTVITRASLKQLRGFLDAAGWTAIWSVNFGRGTLDEAIVEAKDVAQFLGPRLLAIELGNEVENYSRGTHPLRPAPYDYETFRAEYTRWRAAILQAVPGLRFAAPDTAASVEWVERMAAEAHGDVQLLTTHYYRGDQRLGTQEQLLHADPKLNTNLERLRKASAASGIPWRMCETNSFFGGGRPGVSDTLAGALWTLDYLLLLAQSGCAGVNLETGVNQLGFISSYSPIQNDLAGHSTAGPSYYGMLAFAQATSDAPSVLPITFDPAHLDVTAYALGDGLRLRQIVLLNKTTCTPIRLSLKDLPFRQAAALRLLAPSLGSKDGITFGNTSVDSMGHWTSGKPAAVKDTLLIPPGSAVLVR